MKILMINVVCGVGSTGRICTDIAKELENRGHDVKIAYGRGDVPEQYRKYAIRIGNNLDVLFHGLKARCFDKCGFGSKKTTEKFVEWVREYNPDIIHLHNLHGYYLNVEILFNYLRCCGKKIVWTLHDCWAFTGHSAYCEYSNCNKWEKGCLKCVNTKSYPASLVDNSKYNWAKKRELFAGIDNLTIVVPSEWLSKLVSRSFLSNYKVCVINNGIDTDIFRPSKSDVFDNLGLLDKKVILGVSSTWEGRKGLEDFIRLAKIISEEYKIVLVGLSSKQIKKLPSNIIGLRKTNSAKELAEIYSSSYVYVNPTYEDNYPTTNLEAVSCGIPVVTYDTGGSKESALWYGEYSVKKGDIQQIWNRIENLPYIKNKVESDKEEGDVRIDISKFVERYQELYFA